MKNSSFNRLDFLYDYLAHELFIAQRKPFESSSFHLSHAP